MSERSIRPADAKSMRSSLPTSLDDLYALATPTLRLGVTGLSRAGKTVFITSLVRNLTRGGRLPFFTAMAEGRIVRAYLEPQPDDDIPRFSYEEHVGLLCTPPPSWPESTRRISELRVTIEYEPTGMVWRRFGTGRLHVDIVDYPGEWLIDLAMMGQSYATWSQGALALARAPARATAARDWLSHLAALDPAAPQDEQVAREAARSFTGYLSSARAAQTASPTLGPGRFLMPGDLEGSPLLTFAPLDIKSGSAITKGSLAAMMERRYESYKEKVVEPFFRDHFSRLDRQIVLVDALGAINAGPEAVEELTVALEACLAAFRPGRASWLSFLLGHRVDRLLFAATKADHLHHTSHDRLEAALRHLTDAAARRAQMKGADVAVIALAALRATAEIEAKVAGDTLACIKGTPLAGEMIDGKRYDGTKDAAIFPGDLPPNPAAAGAHAGALEIVRFAPPRDLADAAAWPHIRLDRALEFLIGDRLA